MRTTIDLPEELLRRVKAAAALRGLKLKDLVATLIAQGLEAPATQQVTGQKRPVPVRIAPAGRRLRSFSNAEVEALFVREDLERLGRDRPA
ncbi:MAG: hypothetical protein ACYC96_15660 [Fimbriimonadaceae bacterium]